jgi:hypothetical protein
MRVMTHLRMPAELVSNRVRWGIKRTPQGEYLFSLSEWQAIKYISESGLVLQAEDVAYLGVFPERVVRSLDYGVQRGLGAEARTYRYAESKNIAGYILSVFSGDRDLGYYGVRAS